MDIHHVGYYVKDINKSIKRFEELDYVRISDTQLDEDRKVRICFLKKGHYVIELVSPVDGCNVISKKLKSIGETPYHICYKCRNLEKEVNSLISKGYIIIQQPSSACAIEGKQVVFLYAQGMGIIELVEMEED